MSRVLTNNISLAYAVEESVGVLPASPAWKLLEPNSINALGASVTTVARSPISKARQRRKGTVVDLDSAVEFDADLTMEHLIDFIEAFMFARFATGVKAFAPTAVTATGYTVASGGNLAQNTLVYARGFTNTANNGLKVVGAASTATEIKTSGLTVEAAPPSNAEVVVVGFRTAAGDLDVDASGNLTATALDFTTLGLTVGQAIWVGGDLAANRFTNAANKGFARVTAIAAGTLTLDKKSQAFVAEANAAQLVDIYFGRFCRNVSVDHADYIERSFQFEAAYPDLAAGPADAYEYAKGNFANTLSFELPLTDKATMTLGFSGTDTAVPTTVRATNAATPKSPLKTGAFNTSADIARLRVQDTDEAGLTTDFKSIKLSLNNHVSPEKVLGTLGAKFMNTGNFEVDVEAQLLFTSETVVTRIRANTRVTMDFAIRNDDGAVLFDIPSMTLGDGAREYPVNESVLINTTGEAYGDATLGYSLGVTVFAYCPNF